MRTIAILRLSTNDALPKIYHTFNLPENDEPGFYQQVVSFNAFTENMAQNTYKFMKKYRRYPAFNWYIQSDHWDKGYIDRIVQLGAEFVAHHSDVYQLYKAIGYSQARRRIVDLKP